MRHLIFILADHFEPTLAREAEIWLREYPPFARRFADSAGRPPQHTWFYDSDDPAALAALARLCRMRLGEIEVHLHHGRDSAEGLREKLGRRIMAYAEHGALTFPGGRPSHAFGFIHGKWSLDNSRGDEHCGVNNELAVLAEAGCYADFTFPAWGRMQPRMRNAIYYATDDPARPKSYDTGVPVQVGRPASGDLMIFLGPGSRSGIPRSLARIPMLPRLVETIWLTCGISAHQPATPRRADRWVAAGVRVEGRPEWVFVKVHAHGARRRDFPALFGPAAEPLYERLQRRYNDGVEWRLHYATCREAWNMVKAAEAGKAGDPSEFRDFLLPPYCNRV